MELSSPRAGDASPLERIRLKARDASSPSAGAAEAESDALRFPLGSLGAGMVALVRAVAKEEGDPCISEPGTGSWDVVSAGPSLGGTDRLVAADAADLDFVGRGRGAGADFGPFAALVSLDPA